MIIQKQQASISIAQLASLIENTPFAQKISLDRIANEHKLTTASLFALLHYLAEQDSAKP